MLWGSLGLEGAILQLLELPNRFSCLWLPLSLKVLILVLIKSLVDTLILRIDTSRMEVCSSNLLPVYSLGTLKWVRALKSLLG